MYRNKFTPKVLQTHQLVTVINLGAKEKDKSSRSSSEKKLLNENFSNIQTGFQKLAETLTKISEHPQNTQTKSGDRHTV